jgi:hypothetical protein
VAKALHDQLTGMDSTARERLYQRGNELFFQLLANSPAKTRPKLLFLFWHVWHHNIVHGDGKAAKASIETSVLYLQNYLKSYMNATTKKLIRIVLSPAAASLT